jgi:hypothetical protein
VSGHRTLDLGRTLVASLYSLFLFLSPAASSAFTFYVLCTLPSLAPGVRERFGTIDCLLHSSHLNYMSDNELEGRSRQRLSEDSKCVQMIDSLNEKLYTRSRPSVTPQKKEKQRKH